MSKQQKGDTLGIVAAAEAYVAAMHAGDWRGAANWFAGDAVRMPPGEPEQRGRDAILRALQGLGQVIEYRVSRDDIEASGRLGYVRGCYATTLRPPGREDPVSDGGLYLEVWRHEPGTGWRIAVVTWNSGAAGPAAGSV